MSRLLEAVFVLAWSLVGLAMNVIEANAVHHGAPDSMSCVEIGLPANHRMLHWTKQ